MKVQVTGIDELARKLQALSDTVAAENLAAATEAGALIVQDDAKERAPYRTGTLRRSIHMERDVVTRSKAEVIVGTDLEYAAIHEFGGTIKARRKPYLVFQTQDGSWHRTKSVTIPARPYLRPALDENKDEVEREMRDALRDLLKQVAE